MASKETASNKGRSQESGSSHEGTSPKTPWDTLKSFVAERGGDIYRRGIELGGTALSAIGARVEGFRSKRDDSRRIELTTPDSEADRNSVEDDKDKVSTSTPESQSGDSGGDEKNDKPVDGSEQDESGVEEDQQQEDSPEARLINRRKESVEKAKQRIEKIEKDENLDENTRNLSLSLARTDLEAAKTSLRAVEEQFGSSVDHSDKTDGDKPEQAKTTPETSTQAEEDDSSDDQAEKNSSAEGSQNSQDGGEQNQGQKPGSLAERIVAVRRQKVEEDQAKLDSLKPGSEEYKAAQAALKKSQERLDSAMKIVNSKEDSTTQEGATDDSAEMKPTDGHRSEQDEGGVEEDYQQEDSPEARLIKRRRESVEKARQRRDAITDDKSLEYQLADRDVEAAEIQLQAVEDQFGSSEQIKEESGADGKRDDIEDKNKGSAESQETSESEDDKKDKKSPEAPTPEDAARAKIAELEKTLNDDNATDDEKYRAAYMRKQLLNGLMSKSSEETKPAGDASTVETDDSSESETVDDSVEAAKKDLEKERSVVAKDLTEAMQQLSEHKPGDPAYNGLLARVKGLRNRFNYISEQIKEESGTDGKRDDIEDKNKGSAESQETSESEDDKKDKKSPEAPTPDNDLEKKVEAARNKYAEIRAEYEQTGMFKKLLKGKELKKRMELARAELEGYMTQLVYQQKDQERSIIANGVEGANEEEQKEARQKAIQSIAAAVLEQHALVDEKTQEEYDKRLDERSLFKKVAAKIGQWFVGKENKDGGKLGLGGWLRSGGAGLAAGVTLGIFGVSFPISSVVGSVSSAGVKVAAHQRALENARGEKRKLSDEELARFASGAQDLEWTTEEKDGSDRKDQSKEAVASMVGAALAETQKDTEKRQKNLTAIGSKAAMGWGLGVAAGRITTELIKSHIIPDQKPANVADTSGGKGTTLQEGQQGFVDSNFEATQPADVTDVPGVTVTPPSETVSLGPDGWVWDRVADVLGAEKATPFLEQLTQTNPDFQFIDLPDGVTGIAYKGNTDPQVVADAIGKVAPDLLKQWVLAA